LSGVLQGFGLAKKARLTVLDVLETPEGGARNEMIRRWAESVWERVLALANVYLKF